MSNFNDNRQDHRSFFRLLEQKFSNFLSQVVFKVSSIKFADCADFFNHKASFLSDLGKQLFVVFQINKTSRYDVGTGYYSSCFGV